MNQLLSVALVAVVATVTPTAVAYTCSTSRGIACAESCDANEVKTTSQLCVQRRGNMCVSWATVCSCTKQVAC